MKKVFYTTAILLSALSLACGKTPGIDDTISDITLSMDTIDADGSSVDTLTVILKNRNASSDKRGVVFASSGGNIAGATDGKVTVSADFLDRELTAQAILTAPISVGDITVTAALATMSANASYLRTKKIIVRRVPAATIHIESSSAGIGSDFVNTDTIIGAIRGPSGKKVSTGTKVAFEDEFENGILVGGVFRYEKSSSDINGQVMAYYSAPLVPIGTVIVITVTVLTDLGAPTGIKDTFNLTVNQ